MTTGQGKMSRCNTKEIWHAILTYFYRANHAMKVYYNIIFIVTIYSFHCEQFSLYFRTQCDVHLCHSTSKGPSAGR